MVTLIDSIRTPPTPADPPSVFEERASNVWADLYRAIPQMNAQAQEGGTSAAAAEAAKVRAIQEADYALGYRNEANAAKGLAQNAAASAGDSASEAVEAKTDAEQARDEAADYAAGMAQAIAMAATFTAVPTTFQAHCITVTQPHLRLMVWDGTKYIRAPWHPVGQVSYSYGATLAGHLPIRADLSYNQADYPDLVSYLGLSGTGTFSLIEARGEFLRVLDNGRGKDAGRVIRSGQLDAIKEHSHSMPIQSADNTAGYAAFRVVGNQESTGQSGAIAGGGATETRPTNIALPLWVSY